MLKKNYVTTNIVECVDVRAVGDMWWKRRSDKMILQCV